MRLDTRCGCGQTELELELDRLAVECHVRDPARLGRTVILAVQLMKQVITPHRESRLVAHDALAAL